MASNVWFITGAGRGLGIDIAQSALAVGHSVVATGRDAARVANAIGEHENLFAVALDITDPAAAENAAAAAVERFGRIDVLVNNAGNFYAGYFENTSPAQVPRADGDELLRPPERHSRDPAGDAQAALRSGHHHHVRRRPHRPGVRRRLRCVEVRP